jgi:T-box protein 20
MYEVWICENHQIDFDCVSLIVFVLIVVICRRMFPTVRVSFSGPLRGQPSDRYAVLMDIVPVDCRRYRYAYHRSSWLVAGKADPPPPPRLYNHPDTPVSADALRKQVISFEKVKLTNNEMDKNGQVSTNSFFHLSLVLSVLPSDRVSP